MKFLGQQIGYGLAERLLLEKYPQRFSEYGDAKWQGFIYGGGPVRVMFDSVIHYGEMGNAGYQAIVNRMLPLRGLAKNFNTRPAHFALKVVQFLQPRLRTWVKNRRIKIRSNSRRMLQDLTPFEEFSVHFAEGRRRDYFLKLLIQQGWKCSGETDAWDLEKAGARILLATESGDGISTRVLFRIWGTEAQEFMKFLKMNVS